MKLYRGLRTKDYQVPTPELVERRKQAWRQLLELRNRGKFDYPEDLNSQIIELHKQSSLFYQHFTDNQEVAADYARQNKGLIISIDPSIDDISCYFSLEFQNYGQRRWQFEVVYIIQGEDLARNQDKWRLTVVDSDKF